jgi:death-on-curing protein
LADALSAHKLALTFGGIDGILNPPMIESALGRPYCGYYPQIWQKAAALVESMARNHGFADGNKRTTVILLDLLVQNSGYSLEPVGEEDIEQALEETVVKVADGKMSFDDLASWFKLRLHLVKKKKTPKKATQP